MWSPLLHHGWYVEIDPLFPLVGGAHLSSSSSSRSSYNRHSDYYTTIIYALSVYLYIYHQPLGLLLSKCGHGIFYVHDFRVCWANEGSLFL